MSTGNLILHPLNPDLALDTEKLVKLLVTIGLADEPLEKPFSYTAGERFLQLITFLGCSPFVRTEAKDENDQDFCHIHLLPSTASPRLFFGKNTRPPRCPDCGKGIGDWLERSTSHPLAEEWICPSCNETISTSSLKWRQQAGFSRLFLVIPGIFPSEAVPLPELLNKLGELGGEWGYFYAQEPRILEKGRLTEL